MKKLMLIMLIGIFLISLVSADTEIDLGKFKQGTCVQLKQICDTCSYVNLTTIEYPDGTQQLLNTNMTKDDVNYYYNFCSTAQIGEYHYTVKGDKGGNVKVERLKFEIKGGILGFIIFAFVLFFGLTFYGIRIKNEWVSLLGCFGLLILGIYISFNGVDLYKNDLTNVISYVTIGIGLGIGFQALKEITYY